jgi:replicative DNA helicase
MTTEQYDDFESMLYGITPTESETPKQEEPKRPQEKPVERFIEPQAQIDERDEIPLPEPPYKPTRYELRQSGTFRKQEQEETRELPHSVDAERSVIGSMLIESDACELVCILLSEEDFYVPAYAATFKAIRDLQSAGKAVDLVTLAEILEQRAEIELVGGMTALLDLIDFVPTAANVKYYVEIVKEHSNRRKVIRASSEIIRDAMEGGNDYLKIAQASVEEIQQSKINEVERVGMRAMQAAIEMGDTKAADFSTGLKEIDKLLKGGFRRGEVVVVGARPSQGKSSFAMNVTNHFLEQDQVVYIQTMDDSEVAFLQRLETRMSLVSGSEIEKYKSSTMGLSFCDEFLKHAEILQTKPLYLDDSPSVTVEYIKEKCKAIKRIEGTIDLVVVDYIGQIDTSTVQSGKRKAGSRAEEVSLVSSKLKILAKELDCVVMVIVQFNRSIDSRQDKRPTMSDLKESGGIEADANIIICPSLPYKDDPSRDPSETVFYILKSKGSQTGSIETIRWDGEHYLFYEGEHPANERFKRRNKGNPNWAEVPKEEIPKEFTEE